MFHRSLFIAAHQVGDRKFYPTYKNVVKSQWKAFDELKEDQEKQLQYLIDFVYRNVPYYHKLFDYLKLSPDDIKKIEDLEKLPILTKDIIKQNWEDLNPVSLDKMKYYTRSTGGSTGTPLQYRLSKYDRFLSGALLYRGWGYAGYELGDKMVFLAGTSLDVGSNPFIIKRAHEVARNIKKLSAFDMDNNEMLKYTKIIDSFKPKFIRGYASSIDFFAKYIEDNDISINSPSSIFTTAEKLYPHMGQRISSAFGCEVYDGYGLNDGGVSAYECKEHNGLHVDTERSIMEIVSDDGGQISCGEGKILATSLHNYAMPLIRYETGDLGDLTDDVCSCGRHSMLLKNIVGRDKELLVTPAGKYVHGAAFYNDIICEFKDSNEIMECQIVQKNKDSIIFNMVCKNNFDMSQLDNVRDIIRKRSDGWEVEFKILDEIERTKAGKYKFIISKL